MYAQSRMDLWDKLALWARRYDRQVNARTGDHRFSLSDVLEELRLKTILELTLYSNGKAGETFRPDPVRKLKLSLLDQGSALLGQPQVRWYEIHATAPSGAYSRIKVVAMTGEGAPAGEVRMLTTGRAMDLYFDEDPIFETMRKL